jgi:hypothetical protein
MLQTCKHVAHSNALASTLSFVTSRVFSNCANDLMTLEGLLVPVRSSPFAVSTLMLR